MRILLLLACALPIWAADPKFTDGLWSEIRPIYAKTLEHPFLKGLADGTLPPERFRFYMLQDALYLGRFSKALSALASKAPGEEPAIFFNNGAVNCIRTERKLHETYFQRADLERAEMAPVNYAYTNHLLATIHRGTFAEGLAAVLPCYWIYGEVGKELKKRGSKKADYQRWIDQYASEDFSASVHQALAMMNAEASRLDPAARRAVLKIFVLSARYEYLFWDMAWRQEKWLP